MVEFASKCLTCQQVKIEYPKTDVPSEKTIQTLEEKLGACALDWKSGWETHLTLVEFAYNNSWHASIRMVLYEKLYRQCCHSVAEVCTRS